MKRYFLKFSIAIISLTSLLNCTKNSTEDVFNELSDLTKEVIARPTLQEMKQGQALLSSNERQKLWEIKLNYLLTNPRENFTYQQRLIIIDLKNFLTKNSIQKLLATPAIGEVYLSSNYNYFKQHFNKEQLNILIESPYLSKGLVLSKINYETLSTTFLLAPESGFCTCIYDLGCPGPNNTCDNTGCTVNDDYEMCGVFGTSHCKKRCTGSEPHL
jgi:hypothetical protein